MTELPDWTRGVALLGKYDSEYVALATDADGQLYVIAIGVDGTGTARVLRTDDAGQLVMVPRGQGGNYLAVDSDGFITSVVKGDYEGVLTTVTLDDEGRLSAFVIDSIDAWGRLLSVGNAELAARLGSSIVYDRRGLVQLAETFGNGLARWATSTSGTGASVALDVSTMLYDGYSCALTGGSDGSLYAAIEHRVGILPKSRIGLEFAFTLQDVADNIQVFLYYYDGTTLHSSGVRYNYVDQQLEYYDENGVWSLIAEVDVYTVYAKLFHRLKVVVDLDTDLYMRWLFDGDEYLATGEQCATAAAAVAPYARVRIQLTSTSGENAVSYVDNVILTSAEQAN